MKRHKLYVLLAMAWLTAGLACTANAALLTLPQALNQAISASADSARNRSALRLAVMRHYYDALVADREYAAANEYLAMAYVVFDSARAQAGPDWEAQISVKELELRYAQTQERRLAAQHRQRLARHSLSRAMGSSAVPDDLEEPDPPQLPATLPDYADLAKILFERNPEWRASGQMRDPARIRLRQRLQDTLLETLLDIERLRRTTLPRLEREDELAQLRLDKARDDIEHERVSDIGLAMAGTAELAFRRLQVEAELALAVARLEGLLGTPIARLSAS